MSFSPSIELINRLLGEIKAFSNKRLGFVEDEMRFAREFQPLFIIKDQNGLFAKYTKMINDISDRNVFVHFIAVILNDLSSKKVLNLGDQIELSMALMFFCGFINKPSDANTCMMISKLCTNKLLMNTEVQGSFLMFSLDSFVAQCCRDGCNIIPFLIDDFPIIAKSDGVHRFISLVKASLANETSIVSFLNSFKKILIKSNEEIHLILIPLLLDVVLMVIIMYPDNLLKSSKNPILNDMYDNYSYLLSKNDQKSSYITPIAAFFLFLSNYQGLKSMKDRIESTSSFFQKIFPLNGTLVSFLSCFVMASCFSSFDEHCSALYDGLLLEIKQAVLIFDIEKLCADNLFIHYFYSFKSLCLEKNIVHKLNLSEFDVEQSILMVKYVETLTTRAVFFRLVDKGNFLFIGDLIIYMLTQINNIVIKPSENYHVPALNNSFYSFFSMVFRWKSNIADYYSKFFRSADDINHSIILTIQCLNNKCIPLPIPYVLFICEYMESSQFWKFSQSVTCIDEVNRFHLSIIQALYQVLSQTKFSLFQSPEIFITYLNSLISSIISYINFSSVMDSKHFNVFHQICFDSVILFQALYTDYPNSLLIATSKYIQELSVLLSRPIPKDLSANTLKDLYNISFSAISYQSSGIFYTLQFLYNHENQFIIFLNDFFSQLCEKIPINEKIVNVFSKLNIECGFLVLKHALSQIKYSINKQRYSNIQLISNLIRIIYSILIGFKNNNAIGLYIMNEDLSTILYFLNFYTVDSHNTDLLATISDIYDLFNDLKMINHCFASESLFISLEQCLTFISENLSDLPSIQNFLQLVRVFSFSTKLEKSNRNIEASKHFAYQRRFFYSIFFMLWNCYRILESYSFLCDIIHEIIIVLLKNNFAICVDALFEIIEFPNIKRSNPFISAFLNVINDKSLEKITINQKFGNFVIKTPFFELSTEQIFINGPKTPYSYYYLIELFFSLGYHRNLLDRVIECSNDSKSSFIRAYVKFFVQNIDIKLLYQAYKQNDIPLFSSCLEFNSDFIYLTNIVKNGKESHISVIELFLGDLLYFPSFFEIPEMGNMNLADLFLSRITINPVFINQINESFNKVGQSEMGIQTEPNISYPKLLELFCNPIAPIDCVDVFKIDDLDCHILNEMIKVSLMYKYEPLTNAWVIKCSSFASHFIPYIGKYFGLHISKESTDVFLIFDLTSSNITYSENLVETIAAIWGEYSNQISKVFFINITFQISKYIKLIPKNVFSKIFFFSSLDQVTSYFPKIMLSYQAINLLSKTDMRMSIIFDRLPSVVVFHKWDFSIMNEMEINGNIFARSLTIPYSKMGEIGVVKDYIIKISNSEGHKLLDFESQYAQEIASILKKKVSFVLSMKTNMKFISKSDIDRVEKIIEKSLYYYIEKGKNLSSIGLCIFEKVLIGQYSSFLLQSESSLSICINFKCLLKSTYFFDVYYSVFNYCIKNNAFIKFKDFLIKGFMCLDDFQLTKLMKMVIQAQNRSSETDFQVQSLLSFIENKEFFSRMIRVYFQAEIFPPSFRFIASKSLDCFMNELLKYQPSNNEYASILNILPYVTFDIFLLDQNYGIFSMKYGLHRLYNGKDKEIGLSYQVLISVIRWFCLNSSTDDRLLSVIQSIDHVKSISNISHVFDICQKIASIHDCQNQFICSFCDIDCGLCIYLSCLSGSVSKKASLYRFLSLMKKTTIFENDLLLSLLSHLSKELSEFLREFFNIGLFHLTYKNPIIQQLSLELMIHCVSFDFHILNNTVSVSYLIELLEEILENRFIISQSLCFLKICLEKQVLSNDNLNLLYIPYFCYSSNLEIIRSIDMNHQAAFYMLRIYFNGKPPLKCSLRILDCLNQYYQENKSIAQISKAMILKNVPQLLETEPNSKICSKLAHLLLIVEGTKAVDYQHMNEKQLSINIDTIYNTIMFKLENEKVSL